VTANTAGKFAPREIIIFQEWREFFTATNERWSRGCNGCDVMADTRGLGLIWTENKKTPPSLPVLCPYKYDKCLSCGGGGGERVMCGKLVG